MISSDNANLLYYGLFISMWAAAYFMETVSCTLIYSVAIVIYNEGGLAAIPIVKNVIGAIGLACYCWGSTIILGMVLEHVAGLQQNQSRTALKLTVCQMREGN